MHSPLTRAVFLSAREAGITRAEAEYSQDAFEGELSDG